MGGTCTKVNVFKRRTRKRSAKIAVMHETTIRIEERSSSDILKELQNAGLFTNLQDGGLSYMLTNKDTETSIRPRRLPKITPCKKPKSVSGLPVYSNEEREIMAEIRRQNNLKEKGKMAKIFRERREKVLERRKKNKDLEEERVKGENEKELNRATDTEVQGKQKTIGGDDGH